MDFSYFNKITLEKLSGKWLNSSLITLLFLALIFLSLIFTKFFYYENFIYIYYSLLSIFFIPLSFGFISTFFKLYNGEKVKPSDIFILGFNNLKKSLAIFFRIFLKILIPIILITFILVSISRIFSDFLRNNIIIISYYCVFFFLFYNNVS